MFTKLVFKLTLDINARTTIIPYMYQWISTVEITHKLLKKILHDKNVVKDIIILALNVTRSKILFKRCHAIRWVISKFTYPTFVLLVKGCSENHDRSHYCIWGWRVHRRFGCSRHNRRTRCSQKFRVRWTGAQQVRQVSHWLRSMYLYFKNTTLGSSSLDSK